MRERERGVVRKKRNFFKMSSTMKMEMFSERDKNEREKWNLGGVEHMCVWVRNLFGWENNKRPRNTRPLHNADRPTDRLDTFSLRSLPSFFFFFFFSYNDWMYVCEYMRIRGSLLCFTCSTAAIQLFNSWVRVKIPLSSTSNNKWKLKI